MSEDFSNNNYNKNLKDYARKLRNNSTLAEVILWDEVLKQKQLKGYSFLRQRPIGNYIVDFFCKDLKLIIELDGTIHRFQKSKDKKREENLKAMGYKIIRLQNQEILKNIRNVKISLELYIGEIEKV
jgi:very-short-patch-repair endonuclease